jgi:hypothetical protein
MGERDAWMGERRWGRRERGWFWGEGAKHMEITRILVNHCPSLSGL